MIKKLAQKLAPWVVTIVVLGGLIVGGWGYDGPKPTNPYPYGDSYMPQDVGQDCYER